MSKLTVDERQEKLEKVARIDPVVLAKTSARELRKLASGLIDNYSKLKVAELLAAITEAVAETRDRLILEDRRKALEALAKSETPEKAEVRSAHKQLYVPRSVEEIANELMMSLRDVVGSTDDYEQKLGRVNALALRFMDQQRDRYTVKTQKKNLTELRQVLTAVLVQYDSAMYYQDLQYVTTKFLSSVASIFKESSKLIQVEYQVKTSLQSRNLEPIDGFGMVEKAKAVLERLVACESVDFLDVVIALALVTGRRCSELLGNSTELRAISVDTLEFIGQLKARHSVDRKSESLQIPSLVDTKLVIHGFDYLRTVGKTLDDPEVINTKYGTPLRRALRKYGWNVFYEPLKVHDLRKVYATLALVNKPTNQTPNGYLATILGHGEADISTANSYQYFYLKGS